MKGSEVLPRIPFLYYCFLFNAQDTYQKSNASGDLDFISRYSSCFRTGVSNSKQYKLVAFSQYHPLLPTLASLLCNSIGRTPTADEDRRKSRVSSERNNRRHSRRVRSVFPRVRLRRALKARTKLELAPVLGLCQWEGKLRDGRVSAGVTWSSLAKWLATC